MEMEDGDGGAKVQFKEFDCPTCDANNPHDDGFGIRDELICQYCGSNFVVFAIGDRKPKLREI